MHWVGSSVMYSQLTLSKFTELCTHCTDRDCLFKKGSRLYLSLQRSLGACKPQRKVLYLLLTLIMKSSRNKAIPGCRTLAVHHVLHGNALDFLLYRWQYSKVNNLERYLSLHGAKDCNDILFMSKKLCACVTFVF